MTSWILGLAAAVVLVVLYDIAQRKHAILHNYPIIGHFRYMLEAVGPELRQYIVTSNDEERPFSRDQRRWVYASAKQQNNYFGFGSDNDAEQRSNYLIIKQAAFPHTPPSAASHDGRHAIPAAKVLGGHRGRTHAFRPASVVNVSAMSFGSLSAHAVQALNRGCAIADCLHNTGEGGISPHHDHGGGLIWQLGTGYFGARDAQGRFDLDRLVETCGRHQVRAVEIKLSQGAKPGKGGVLPGGKVTAEIAAIRGIAVGKDCLSPSSHSAFGDVDSLLDFVERIAQATGLPVGIKSAVGALGILDASWQLDRWTRGDRGVDFVAVDGGEGGTGAAPLAFSDHVALPFKLGMSSGLPCVRRARAASGTMVFVGRLGQARLSRDRPSWPSALGCDLLAVAREPMLAIGCIQAQRCHTGHCPAGVATQNRWLMRGLDPTSKADRLANYMATLRHDLLQLAWACGEAHPSLVGLDSLEILDGCFGSRTAREVFGYQPGWGLPGDSARAQIRQIMSSAAVGG